jgi:hypothetical protein
MMSSVNSVEREQGSSQRAVYSYLESQKVAHVPPLFGCLNYLLIFFPPIATSLRRCNYLALV